jgi:hypothetical protein
MRDFPDPLTNEVLESRSELRRAHRRSLVAAADLNSPQTPWERHLTRKEFADAEREFAYLRLRERLRGW